MKTVLFQIALFYSLVLANNSFIIEKELLEGTFIDIHDQNIPIIDNKTFLAMKLMTQLSLRNDSIQVIKEDAFKTHDLRRLSLVENNLTTLKGIGNLPNLTHLILNKNSINFIKEGDIINLSSLSVLDLSENNLTQIYTDFFYFLPSLIDLNVSCNKLSDIPHSFTNISLSTLDASYNNLIEPDIKNVRDYVNVSHNLINYIKFAETVRLISCSHNKISNLQSTVHYLQNLTSADFSHNNIKNYWFYDIPNLKEFNLSFNSISSIHVGTFKTQEKLEILDLSNNDITELDYGCFTGLSKLIFLDLSGNNISKWQALYTLDTVEQLYLQDNLLNSLNPKLVVQHLKNLVSISINFNSISCEELIWYIQIFTEHRIWVDLGSIHNTSNVRGMKCDDTKIFFNLTTINEMRIVHVINYIGEIYSMLIVVLVVCMLALIVKMLKLYRVTVVYFKENKSAQELHSCSLKLLSETDSVDC